MSSPMNNDTFEFSRENQPKVDAILAKYPERHKASAVMPLLDLAQRQHGWLSQAVMDHVAGLLSMAPIRVYEVATFYSMYYTKPMGEHIVQVCTTTPCMLRGSEGIVSACKSKLGIGFGQTTEDSKFSLVEVECLGACVNAPMVQINDHYYEDLTPERMTELLESLAASKPVQKGSQTGRVGSEPVGERTTLSPSFLKTLTESKQDKRNAS